MTNGFFKVIYSKKNILHLLKYSKFFKLFKLPFFINHKITKLLYSKNKSLINQINYIDNGLK